MDISKGIHLDFDDIPTYELALPNNRYYLIRGRPVLGERKECLGAVVNLMDISPMKMIEKIRSEFVAKLTHELRSPLSTIHEQLAVVMDGMDEKKKEGGLNLLSRAKDKTKTLISTIGDLLDLSRIEAGMASRETQSLDLAEHLQRLMDFYRIKAKVKKIDFSLLLPDEPLPPLPADPVSIESIFGNLIANAINYTPENGKITVQVSHTGINLEVKVTDTGFGIEEKYIDKVFEKFYRIKNDRTRFITGTGLGLPIVKGILDSMGGFISVESEVGVGTTFTVLLPVQRTANLF